MSSATGRKPTDAGSLLTGRRRIPPGDAANAANPVNAQHLPDCSAADFPAPQALSTSFLPTLPRQATPDVLPANIPSPLTPLVFSFRYRVFSANRSKYISSASVQLKSCISLPKSESPRYSPFTYKICVPHYHRTLSLSILITTI